MKTSKTMQLRILDKMRENVENDANIMREIEVYNRHKEKWINSIGALNFNIDLYRIKPQTITINGVEISKPLGDHEIIDDVFYYFVDNSHSLHNQKNGIYIKNFGIRFVYRTKEEAIKASKLLFGIKD